MLASLLDDSVRRNPYALYAQLRRAQPVMEAPGLNLWALFRYDDVKRALTDHEAFSSAVSSTRNHSFEWLMFMDPPRHTRLRAIVSRAFTPRSIDALAPRIAELSRGLLDELLPRGRFDLVTEYATPLPLLVIAEMLGVALTDWRRLADWSEAIMGLGATILGTPAQAQAASARFLAAQEEMKQFLDGELAVRRVAPRDDLLTRLVTAEVDGGHLSDEELLRFFQLLLAAGTETTTNLIDNAVIALVENPAEMARLRAEPGLVPSAIEEVLRWRAPAQAMFRTPRRDVEIGGRTIPAGQMVLAVIGSANRDEEQFPDAERFDVGRDPNPHVAFGHGIHFCLGAPLSRLEGRVALTDLLARTTSIALASAEPWKPRAAFHVHGPVSLPVVVE